MTKVQVLIGLDPDDRERLKDQADKTRVSMSEICRRALREYFERQEANGRQQSDG